MSRPKKIRIVEVGPRDGLQNESAELPVADRIELIERLADTGLTSIEAGAFVSPKWVPQMAGTGAVLAGLRHRKGVTYPVLVPNMVGFEAALRAGATEMAVFASASETFSRRNINATIAESFERFREVSAAAKDAGIKLRGYVSCVLGCPFEGDVPVAKVVEVAGALSDLGCHEISLGDTIGVGTPDRAAELLEALVPRIPPEKLALHFHDTYGQALANILACLDFGIASIDAAVAGLGGCPYARGATGNVATEDVVYMLNGLGIETGVDLNALARVGGWISERLGKPSQSRAGKAILAKRSP